MTGAQVCVMYLAMIVFDAAVLAGTAWLIGWHGWSAWWMVLAIMACLGANPKYLIATATGNKAAEYDPKGSP